MSDEDARKWSKATVSQVGTRHHVSHLYAARYNLYLTHIFM